MGHEGHDHGHHHHDLDPKLGPAHSHDHGLPHDHGHPAPVSSVQSHKAAAPAQVATFVVTCSDSRDAAHDQTGPTIRRALEAEGHPLVGFRLIPDEPMEIGAALEAAVQAGARAVIFNGGTGVSRRDVTVETLERLFEKRLPGFGELFRMLSYQQIGSAAWLSRATAGVWQGMVIFAIPGSPKGSELAVRQLILPELGHVVRELSR